ncbi:unnamed protein product, partial [Meganyctiphanes norvegica]
VHKHLSHKKTNMILEDDSDDILRLVQGLFVNDRNHLTDDLQDILLNDKLSDNHVKANLQDLAHHLADDSGLMDNHVHDNRIYKTDVFDNRVYDSGIHSNDVYGSNLLDAYSNDVGSNLLDAYSNDVGSNHVYDSDILDAYSNDVGSNHVYDSDLHDSSAYSNDAGPKWNHRLQQDLIATNAVDDYDIDLSAYTAQVAPVPRPVPEKGRSHVNAHNYMAHEEVCQTKKTWKLLNQTVDREGNLVEVIQMETEPKQWVYVYECDNECGACKGVSVNSRCKMRYTWQKMYHRRLDCTDNTWDYVEVPSHCACELLPYDVPDVDCPPRI